MKNRSKPTNSQKKRVTAVDFSREGKEKRMVSSTWEHRGKKSDLKPFKKKGKLRKKISSPPP